MYPLKSEGVGEHKNQHFLFSGGFREFKAHESTFCRWSVKKLHSSVGRKERIGMERMEWMDGEGGISTY